METPSLKDSCKANTKTFIKNEKFLKTENFLNEFKDLTVDEKKHFIHTLIECVDEDIVPGGFRSYDIRIGSENLPDHVVFYIGLKAVSLLKEFTGYTDNIPFTIGVGRAAEHARPSSKRIQNAYINGLRLAGAKIIDLGVTTTPDIYFASAYLLNEGINCVVNISASHNPKHDNGIKHCIVSEDGFIHSISASQMTEIKKHTVSDFKEKIASDKSLEVYLTTPYLELQAYEKISDDENFICDIHNAFLVLYSLLGKDIVCAINTLLNSNFKNLIKLFSSKSSPDEILNDILSLTEKPWDKTLKRINLPEDTPKPFHFKKDVFKDFVIILDYALGSGHRTASIYESLGAHVIELDRERGFNPLEAKNQAFLKETILKAAKDYPDKEVIGFAHDEDADRLAVMRSDGVPVPGDRLLVLTCMQQLLPLTGNKTPLVVTEVKSRPETRITLENLGIKCLIVPTGFAFIKDAAIQIEKAISAFEHDPENSPSFITLYDQTLDLSVTGRVFMWAELSGHFGFSQNLSYFFDDASLMAVNFLLCLYKTKNEGSHPGSILIDLDKSFPSYPSSGELNVFVKTSDPDYVPASQEKEKIVNAFANELKSNPLVGKIDQTDGIQVFFKNEKNEFIGWILIRKSNNEDKLVVVTSAPTEPLLDKIETIFLTLAKKVEAFPITGLVLTERDSQGHERHPDPYIEHRIKELF